MNTAALDRSLSRDVGPSRSFGRLAANQLLRDRVAVIALIFLVLVGAAALLAPIIAPYKPLEIDPTAAYAPPSLAHVLGTDSLGRDILTRIIYGARISAPLGLIAVGIGGIIGGLLGLMAGFYGRAIDTIVMRFMDILLAFPGFMLALAVVSFLGTGIWNVMIAVGVSLMPSFSRLIRGSVLSAREEEYVTAAHVCGCGGSRILFRHILPNVIAPTIVFATISVAGAILTGAGLSFLGVGAQPPHAEWGLMVNEGRPYLQVAWWISTIPSLAIMVTVIAINQLGDGLRDALDPRLHV